MLPDVDDHDQNPDVRWFSATGCVTHFPHRLMVCVGGSEIGSFTPDQRSVRNTLLVGLARNPSIRRGKLAKAFGITAETLRWVIRKVEAGGMEALPTEGPGGARREPKDTPALRKALFKLFDEGLGARPAHRALPKRFSVSHTLVWQVYQQWQALKELDEAEIPAAAPAESPDASPQQQLPGMASDQQEPVSENRPSETGSVDEKDGGFETIALAPVRGGRNVQHVGTWLMLAMAEQHHLYDAALGELWGEQRGAAQLRVALDAVIAALSIGEGCVEGVRRLATSSAGRLLRTDQAPSASWVRRVLKRFAGGRNELNGWRLHLLLAGMYMRQAQAGSEHAAVYYVDNHMRPYTGKFTTRKGWRMQDKRVRPGATDYWVHSEDGRPVMRVADPSNASLTAWLGGIADMLRQGLGDDQRILLAFDRAGAFPQQMVELRNDKIEFVTYERRPYALLSPGQFNQELVSEEGERIGMYERRTNLGKKRGRVRRIALRMEDGHQVNLLASSAEPAARLVGVMLGRWCQENGFKHGVERWGINQLDGRKTIDYRPDTVIPNPARRRLDRDLRLARLDEGKARRELARLDKDHPKREREQKKLEDALNRQLDLEALQPSTPTHAPLEETELAGKLVYHPGNYKAVLDSIRIVCANAESDLAYTLAPYLKKPREAKKALANLFKAPGSVRVEQDRILVHLDPAGTRNEKEALATVLEALDGWLLVLPGDKSRRLLRFRSQI